MRARGHKHIIPYHWQCEDILKSLGLYQVSQMKVANVDSSLLSGLLERWRPETHTFHLPVGEMTITLEDVSCLWALPITGLPVTGMSDGNWEGLVNECLGVGAWDALMKPKKRSSAIQKSGYAINLKSLRNRFKAMPSGQGEPTPEQIHQYTRAYILDLFGSLLFTDSSGDSVPVMYLQFLRNLNTPGQYNWGGAVLALLYRNLCWGATRKAKMVKTLAGPVVLLQHWAWSRLQTGRPCPYKGWAPDWGRPDSQSCPAFGAKWCGPLEYKQPHGKAGVKYFRNQLQDLREGNVDWEPYKQLWSRMPSRVHQDAVFFRARVPLVHFWIVEHHYPDRVMRQFGYRQAIPVLEPLPEDDVRKLHRYVHSSMCTTNWSVEHETYVTQSSDLLNNIVPPDEPFSCDQIESYQRWFHQNCMYNIFEVPQVLDGAMSMDLDENDNSEYGYIANGPRNTREVHILNLDSSLLNIQMILCLY